MRHLPKWGVFFVIATLCLVTVFLVMMQSYRYNDIRVFLNESIEVAINETYDNSKRVDDGVTDLNKENFENLVRNEMKKTNVNIEIKDFSFSYLENEKGALQGVKVTVIDDQDTPYSAAYKANTTTEEGNN